MSMSPKIFCTGHRFKWAIVMIVLCMNWDFVWTTNIDYALVIGNLGFSYC